MHLTAADCITAMAGFSTLQAALSRGLLPDDETLKQLVLDPELPLAGRDISTLRWPEEHLRYVLTSKWIHPKNEVCSSSIWLPAG